MWRMKGPRLDRDLSGVDHGPMNHPVQTERSNWPALEILLLMVSVSSEASGEPAHLCRLT